MSTSPSPAPKAFAVPFALPLMLAGEVPKIVDGLKSPSEKSRALAEGRWEVSDFALARVAILGEGWGTLLSLCRFRGLSLVLELL